MKDKILSLLKSADDYLSGESISGELGISRSAVWKHIQKLRDEGYQITSVTNKGYRLSHTPDIINETEILFGLRTDFLGKHLYCTDQTDSTNQLAKAHADMPDGALFLSETQTAGKGRLGRAWTSQKGEGIWMSLLLKPDIEMDCISQLTLVAGLGVCLALRKVCHVDAQIKWPNDIIVNGKKICGILTEMSAEIDRVNYVVCGIGINVNHTQFSDELSVKATSVYLETGKQWTRVPIIQATLYEIEQFYRQFLSGGFAAVRSDYKRHCATLGKEVRILRRGSEQTAFAKDIDTDGELIIEKDGIVSRVNSGEVSVRGIYNYM